MNIQNNSTVTVAGKRVPVVFQNGNGIAIVPGSVERDIVLSFIGSALASPVTGLIVIIGSGYREIRLAVEGTIQGVNTEIFLTRKQAEINKMNQIYHMFSSEISNLEYASYPDDKMKNIYKEILLRKMKVELEKL